MMAAAGLLAAGAVSRADTPSAPPIDDSAIQGSSLGYMIYGGGLKIASASVEIELSPHPSHAELVVEPRGITALFSDFRLESSLKAEDGAGEVLPASYRSSYFKNDRLRRSIEIDYDGGKSIAVRTDPTREEDERPEVPEALRQAAVDPIAAGLTLLLGAAREGTCDNELSVFDGRRLFDLKVQHAGTRELEPSNTYAYAGPVMVCRLSLTRVAGFEKDEIGKKRFPTIVEALVAPSTEGTPALPVRFEADSRIGKVIVRLESIESASKTAQSAKRD